MHPITPKCVFLFTLRCAAARVSHFSQIQRAKTQFHLFFNFQNLEQNSVNGQIWPFCKTTLCFRSDTQKLLDVTAYVQGEQDLRCFLKTAFDQQYSLLKKLLQNVCSTWRTSINRRLSIHYFENVQHLFSSVCFPRSLSSSGGKHIFINPSGTLKVSQTLNSIFRISN